MLSRILHDWRSYVAVGFWGSGVWLTGFSFQRTFGEGMLIGLICVFGGAILLWSVIASPDPEGVE